jgi:hypothetical protein
MEVSVVRRDEEGIPLIAGGQSRGATDSSRNPTHHPFAEIPVPTGGSEASLAAADQSVAIARRSETTVHSLYGADVSTEMSASTAGNIADEFTEPRE